MRPVNLLPESQRGRDPGARAGSAYAVIAGLGLLLVMVGFYVFTANGVTSDENAATEAAAEADRLESEISQLGAYGSFAQVLQARAESVQQLAAQRFDWERLMRELARVLPERGWLQSAEASTTGESAGSPSGAEAAVGQPKLGLVGCTRKQSDVAALMLRLRRLHRVEDVTLNESARAERKSKPSLDSCGSYYEFDLAVLFSPSVVVEEPEGERSVPAALGGGS